VAEEPKELFARMPATVCQKNLSPMIQAKLGQNTFGSNQHVHHRLEQILQMTAVKNIKWRQLVGCIALRLSRQLHYLSYFLNAKHVWFAVWMLLNFCYG